MPDRKYTVLVVEDQSVNRAMIVKMLQASYRLIEAENGLEALKCIQEHEEINAVLLDLVMPVMDGYGFLKNLKTMGKSSIPVIVMTAATDPESEKASLEAGALDFVNKPINPEILKVRLENALQRSQVVLLEKLQYQADHDTLTDLYNRGKMLQETRRVLDQNPDQTFVFVRFDIDQFRIYNSVMGEEEGDSLLKYVANGIRRLVGTIPNAVYGRIAADIFSVCMPYDQALLLEQIETTKRELSAYRTDYSLDISFGIYVIEDHSMKTETMLTRASIASSHCKQTAGFAYAFYQPSMSAAITTEQQIMNDVKKAFEEEQFEVYLQPKYNLSTDLPCGAEALVRWIHPTKGIIPPNDFIPLFEKNGTVARLDRYMWDHVAKLLGKWVSEGKHVDSISVNMSRVSLYNPHVAEEMKQLCEQYGVPTELLNLEVTESAYMSNPELMRETVAKLHEEGFVILMDDFGSGYSSLNTLKEIRIDILKLDMKFLPQGDDQSRAEKIISSMVRMAGWLGMEVIAEGVETVEQKEFLESVGCGYVQGYYYAKPMPVQQYHELVEHTISANLVIEKADPKTLPEVFWSSDERIQQILSGIEVPVAIVEHAGSVVELIRTNPVFQEAFGREACSDFLANLEPGDRALVQHTMDKACEEIKSQECEISYLNGTGVCTWYRMRIKKITEVPNAKLLCCVFEDITTGKLSENRLERLMDLFEEKPIRKKILVIDDVELSRKILSGIFKEEYEIIEAENGIEGLQLLRENFDNISVVLLDMIMPQMDGEEFLKEKNKLDQSGDIPIVVISGESKTSVQLSMLKNGVNDYITKPFDPELTRQRVENVIAYESRFKQLIREYHRDLKEWKS